MSELGNSVSRSRDSSAQRSAVPSRRRRADQIPLESLVQQVATLWGHEPQVAGDLRSELIEELHRLEHRVEVLWLRAEAGAPVPAGEVRDCAQVFLWLRERWTGSVAA